MKRILLVSWYYYPATAVGARRVFNLGKYLERAGHEVTVLTATKSSYGGIDSQLDTTGLDVRVERVRSRFYVRVPPRRTGEGIAEGLARRAPYMFSRLLEPFLFPDAIAGWIRPATRTADTLFDRYRFDIVISSGTPWSSFVAGDRIAARHGVPHVMDYRDPWTAHEYVKFGSARFHARSESLERELLARATRVIVNSKDTARIFVRAFGETLGTKLLLVRNGFDPDVHARLHRQAPARALAHGHKLRLVHTGAYYGSRRLDTFIEAVHRLKQHGGITSENFEMVSFGPLLREDRQLLQEYGLEAFFSEHDFVPYEESLIELTRSSMNLLVVGPEHRAQIPAKLYDYLMAERPIFAIAPVQTEAGAIIEQHDYGICADVTSPADIAEKLGKVLSSRPAAQAMRALRAPAEFNVGEQVLRLASALTEL